MKHASRPIIEMLPNGDIILRRKREAPALRPAPPEGEIEL
jgi:hypothetical protein